VAVPKKPFTPSVVVEQTRSDGSEKSDRCRAVFALQRLCANPELLAIVGRWGDTLGDWGVLLMLRQYNTLSKKVLHRPPMMPRAAVPQTGNLPTAKRVSVDARPATAPPRQGAGPGGGRHVERLHVPEAWNS
jgi:hypothetical protein